MHNRRNALKSFNIGQGFIRKLFIIIPINAVFDNVFAVILFVVDLQVQIIMTASRYHGRKGALADIAVLPCQRVNVFNRYIVQHNTGNIAGDDFAAFVDLLPHNTGDIRHCAKRRLHFLHFVSFNGKIVFLQNAVNKRLLFLPFKRDLDFLIHEQIGPILA